MNGRYFDWGATAFPRSPAISNALDFYLSRGGTYSRTGVGRSLEITRKIESIRRKLSKMLMLQDSSRIIFTSGATFGLNMILRSVVKRNSTVLISPMEHNAVMRTLLFLKDKLNIQLKVMPAFQDGRIDTELLYDFMIENGCNVLVVNHMSNVNGVIQPIEEISSIVSEYSKSKGDLIPFVIDAAQSGGKVKSNLKCHENMSIVFSGHKGFMGLPGIGFTAIGEQLNIAPFTTGGTGSASESVDQPLFLPDALEPGTPNIPGILSLGAAVEFGSGIENQDDDIKSDHFAGERCNCFGSHLINYAVDKLSKLPNIQIYTSEEPEFQGPLFSLSLSDVSPGEAAGILYEKHGIEVRHGLHCAPQAHRHLGTLHKGGTVRISTGPWHTNSDIDYLVEAVKDVIKA